MISAEEARRMSAEGSDFYLNILLDKIETRIKCATSKGKKSCSIDIDDFCPDAVQILEELGYYVRFNAGFVNITW